MRKCVIQKRAGTMILISAKFHNILPLMRRHTIFVKRKGKSKCEIEPEGGTQKKL